MNGTLLKALVALVPATMLLVGSANLFWVARRLPTLLQVLGAAGLVIVTLIHVCEALRLFPVMGWGLEGSPGHYLDLVSAVCGFTFFPLGYLLHAVRHGKP